MAIQDYPAFPRFNAVSTGLRDAEDKLLEAMDSGNKADIAAAKLAIVASIDEYRKVAIGIDEDPVQVGALN